MKIAEHPDLLAHPAPVQLPITRQTSPGQTVGTRETFASLVANSPSATVSTGSASGTAAIEAAPVNPFASWVTCNFSSAGSVSTPAGKSAATVAAPSISIAAPSASTAEVAPLDPLAALVTATPAVTLASTANATPVVPPPQPGIAALIGAIMDGSFQPTYMSPSQLVENSATGVIDNSPAYYASDQTAQQLATLLGGTVVKQVPFASSDAATTAIKANFIQLPGGQTVNAADLAYYVNCAGEGVQQLAADLTQEINQGGAITSYNNQMVAFLSGTGTYPGAGPSIQAGEIGPAITGMTYPPGTLAPDGSVINPNAPAVIAT